MIKVEIDCGEISDVKWVVDTRSYNAWLCIKLQEAGIPIIGGPLLPKVDFSKGVLTSWDEYNTGKKTFVWRPI